MEKAKTMNNSKEAARMMRSIKKLSACGGDCKNCEHAKINTARNGRFGYYAYYCDVDSNIQPYSNTLRDLRQETLEAMATLMELRYDVNGEEVKNDS